MTLSNSTNLPERRCTSCNALLFKGTIDAGIVEHKCSKCGTLNLCIVGAVKAPKSFQDRVLNHQKRA